MMNFPGVLFQDPDVLSKLELFSGRVIDGHSPGLSGKSLCAYIAAGIRSDHECTTLDEAREKLRCGMHILIREGSAAKNLNALLPLVNEFNSRNCSLVTDDLEPGDIVERGHLNASVRAAIAGGLHPVTAVQCASINTTRYFGIPARGAIAPGYYADLQIVEDLNNFKARAVYKEGRLIAENGKALHNDARQPQLPPKSFNVNWEKMGDLRVPLGSGALNVIGVIPGQIVTQRIIEPPKAANGEAIADTDRDLLKIAVIERHKGTGNRGIGFIKGFGLREGALAGSVAHDSHNIITVGTNDRDMLAAAHEVEAMGGGLAAARDGKASARLPLRIAGLMSDRGIGETLEGLHAVVSAAKSMGCALENPYAVMSFMALTPIPELKLTDLGLFDSVNFSFVDLFTG
jgi:adenine deaminase